MIFSRNLRLKPFQCFLYKIRSVVCRSGAQNCISGNRNFKIAEEQRATSKMLHCNVYEQLIIGLFSNLSRRAILWSCGENERWGVGWVNRERPEVMVWL